MTVLAAVIWVVGVMFTWGWSSSLYDGIAAVSRSDKAFIIVAALFAWPAMLGISAECRTRN